MENKAWIYLSTTVTNFLCLFFGIISGVLSARLLGPQARGELAILLYYPGLIGCIFSLAVPQALSFLIAKDLEKQKEIASAGLKLSLILGLVGSLLFALIAPYSLTESNSHLYLAIIVSCLFSLPMVLNPHLYAIHRALHHFDWVNGTILFTAIGYVILLVCLWAIDSLTPLATTIGSLLLQLSISILLIWKLGLSTLKTKIRRETYKNCLMLGIRFFFPVAVITLYVMSDRAILIRTAPLVEIGYYAVAFAVAFPLTILTEAFVQVGFVEISGIKGEQDAKDLIVRRFQMSQLVSLISVLIILMAAQPLIRFGFGKEFLSAIPAARILIPAMALRGLANLLVSSMRAYNLTWPGVVSGLLSLISLGSIGFWLVPPGDIMYFAFAILFAEMVGIVFLVLILCRYLNVNLLDTWGIRPAIFSALSYNLWHALKMRRG